MIDFSKELNRFILVHFLMHCTVVLIVLCWLKALCMLAAVHLVQLLLVLPEVEAFLWEHLAAHGALEIFVGYLAISILVEGAENCFEIAVRDRHSPKLKIKLQFLFANFSCLLDIEIHECFSQCLPLKLDLFEDLRLNITLKQALRSLPFIRTLCDRLPLQIVIILRILHGVMPEIETFRKMNR
jgi:hypothetical protein